jgi:hypothetical protein
MLCAFVFQFFYTVEIFQGRYSVDQIILKGLDDFNLAMLIGLDTPKPHDVSTLHPEYTVD